MKSRNRQRRNTLALLLAWSLLGLQGGMLAAQLPLDPLTPAEIQRARGIADLAPEVNGRVRGQRHVLGSIDFLPPPKPGSPEEPAPPADGRYAQALYCIYEGNRGFRALVDLARNTVLSTEEVSCDEVPIAPEEVQAARDLALADPAVREFLGREADLFRARQAPGAEAPEYLVEAMKVVATEAEDRCFGERCLLLVFSDPEDYRSGLEILVNMTTRRVATTPVEPAEVTSTHAHRTMLKARAGKGSGKEKAPGKGNG